MSPRTQQLQAGMEQGPDQESALFESGMSEMAYNLLSSRMPDVMQDVVTFKVLDTDIDKGTGTGAFVVLRHGQPLYIPVVMVDNAIKPLEIFYSKTLNVFMPLSKGWLDEMDKTGLTALDGGVKTPETLYTDVDIRNVVVPPITGRFSYAAASTDIATMFDAQTLEKIASPGEPMLPKLLAAAPNRLKTAYAKFLEKNPRAFQHVASHYSMSAIAEALRPRAEKLAAKQNYGGALWIADADNTPTDFKRIFGDKAGEAYTGVRKKGFAAKDERLNRNMAVQEQPYERWTEPKQPGCYTLYASDGKERHAFVMPFPIDLFDGGTRYGRRPAVPGHNPLVNNSYYDPQQHGSSIKVYPQGRPNEADYAIRRGHGAKPFLAVFDNGDYIEPSTLVGRDDIADSLAGALHKRLFTDVSGDPKAGKGFFVRQKSTTFQATVPLTIKSISTGSDGVRRIKATGGDFGPEKTIATDPKNPYNTIWMPKGSDVVYLPPDFIWVPLKEHLNEKSFFTNALDLQACVSHMLSSVGAKKVAIKDAGAKQFSINGTAPMNFVPALKKLAHGCGISVDDAEALLVKAAADRSANVWIASPRQLARVQLRMDKLAADDDKPKKKSPPKDDGADAGADPSMGGDPSMGDPNLGQDAAMAAMGQPPAPPPPQPLDLAAMEMDQHIQQEMQKLVEKQQTIQMLLQRSSEISGGAPPAPSVQTQAMGAPPSSMNLATGQPGMPPGMTAGMGQPPAQTGMDPSMMGGDPSMMGGQPGMDPGMDPSMAQGTDPSMAPQPGMDPSMGGQPGMDPSQGMGGQQQPQMPNGTMPPDGPNAQTLPQEVNPQFLDQAAQLHSADMFDAAAVATLAQSPALHGIVGQYLPNLEKAVDNLGRVLLTLWMQEGDLKPQIGEQTFSGLEENLQTTFKGLGDLVLRLSRGVQAIKNPDDHAA
ncbi:MAG TPA: hypothetical protein VFH61_01575 [Thermoleophilia bacterium]|nr:hypothetical protein [Thermoleophilia bacterium]